MKKANFLKKDYKMIKYTDAQITFREVPDEISLSINISNCPYKCQGCHSPRLQQNIGKELTKEIIYDLIEQHKSEITCVTFLGDGGNMKEIADLIKYVHLNGYLTCLYTGSTNIDDIIHECDGCLNFLKIGQYVKKFGGLDSSSTNQRFIKIHYKDDANGKKFVEYKDLTERFRIKY